MKNFLVKLSVSFLTLTFLISSLSQPAAAAVEITVVGPQGEDGSQRPGLPGVELVKEPIFYIVRVDGLDPGESYHIKFYETDGYDGNVGDNRDDDDGGTTPSNVDSQCGTADRAGTLITRYDDTNLPNKGYSEGPKRFILEVATNAGGDAVGPGDFGLGIGDLIDPRGNDPISAGRGIGEGVFKRLRSDTCKRGTYVRHISVYVHESKENYDPKSDISFLYEDESGNAAREASTLQQILLSFFIGIAGGMAFLLMVYGSFRLIFAGGNPEAIQEGRQIITAAIAGLLLIIFSVFLIRLIGGSILKLPPF